MMRIDMLGILQGLQDFNVFDIPSANSNVMTVKKLNPLLLVCAL